MNTKIVRLIVMLAIIALVFAALDGKAPAAVPFKHLNRDSLFGTLCWLFVVALFIERAVEVIVSTLRDAAPLELAVQEARDGAGARPEQIHAEQTKLLNYRYETKKLALSVSFVLGLVVSLAGVRSFSSISDEVPPSNWLFSAADILVTGALLAGGTAAIHQMMTVLTKFLEHAADKAKSD